MDNRQPPLHDRLICVRAPMHAWSAQNGNLGTGIDGIYLSDLRLISHRRLRIPGHQLEHLVSSRQGSAGVRVESMLRFDDQPTGDPLFRVVQHRQLEPDQCAETVELTNLTGHRKRLTVAVELRSDLAPIHLVRRGSRLAPVPASTAMTIAGAIVRWTGEETTVTVRSPDATIELTTQTRATLSWNVDLPNGGSQTLHWTTRATSNTPATVIPPQQTPPERQPADTGDRRLNSWINQSWQDLDALRMATSRRPEDDFLAAGAPWYFTLFGRDSIIAAQLLLGADPDLAAGTLGALAAYQGTSYQPDSAEQPGRIPHEIRRAEHRPHQGMTLPPVYYGSVDATPLWICLLHDTWQAGMPAERVRQLLPALEAAAGWLTRDADADGDGFVEYFDETGQGLVNQGWKDSADAIQFRDGTLATGPIALVEVQAFAYEAARSAAKLLTAFDRPGAEQLNSWAARLRTRFHSHFWLRDEIGPYLAIALDHRKRPVDTVTSNMGQVLGTGILDQVQAAQIVNRLTHPELVSGFGLRTMATSSAGYWPTKYHCGSVWPHDTALTIRGMLREGHQGPARQLANALLDAAEASGYRLPELFSGADRDETTTVVPYAMSCRPQAWAAASAITAAAALGRY